jgi:phage tail-like protein
MARSRLDDLLQAYRSHLIDIVPSAVPPFLAFTPSLGFNSISAPELTLSNEEVKDGVSPWVRKIIGKANATQIVARRGVRYWDDDFWQWTQNAILGAQSPRKTLLLLHLTGVSPDLVGDGLLPTSVADLNTWGEVKSCVGRMWLLTGCIPARYKAASDFDSTDSSVSIQELAIDVESFQQINLDNSVNFAKEL